jgi:hypothetical protein
MFGKKKEQGPPPPDPLAGVLVITGDLNVDYQVIDAVFAFDSHKEGFLTVADPSKAFVGVRKQLREQAVGIGANAIINCQFEYRTTAEANLFGGGHKERIEIFAYGTAVRRL